MDTDRSSQELLGHFGRQQRIYPDFDWDETDCRASEFDPAAVVNSTMIGDSLAARCAPPEPHRVTGEPPVATIGVWRVLQWAAAVVVFSVAGHVLLAFFERLSAERSLQLAARAGALEAILPRASYESVQGTVERRAARIPALESLELMLLQNGGPVFQRLTENDGDVISVTVTARMPSLIPTWLRWLPAVGDDNQLTARAEQRRPCRKAAPQKYQSGTR